MAVRLLCLLAVALGAEWWEGSKAPLWDTTAFAALIGGEKYVLVEFFTPWCHFCHMMSPEFEHFYASFQEESSADYRPDLIVGRVNAGVEQILAYNNRVSAFPTILIFEPRNKDAKHRVEGYQRRYDLARLVTHALPEKSTITPKQVSVSAPSPTSQPQEPAQTPPSPQPQEQIKPTSPPPVELIPPSFPSESASETPLHVQTDNPQFEEIMEESLDDLGREGKVLEPMEDLLEDEDKDIEVEYEIVYRDSAAAIKDELNETYHRLLSSFQALPLATDSSLLPLHDLLKDLKALHREENLRAAERFDKMEARLEELHLDVKQRNRLESAQTRLNMSHMLLFLGIGALVGAALSMLLGKVTNQEKDRTKV